MTPENHIGTAIIFKELIDTGVLDIGGEGLLDEDKALRFGSRLRKLRESHGQGLSSASAKIGIDSSYLSLIERGKRNPSFEVLYSIAESLDQPIFDLLEEAGRIIIDEDRITDPQLHVVKKIINDKKPFIIRS